MRLYAGTSGYSYKEWKGNFYPEKLSAEEMLAYYATKLPAVEINNTFYRMPRENVVASWAEGVPEDFRFSIKASRRITHIKRLKNAAEETDYLIRTLRVLEQRLGVILFQLPPNLSKDLFRLREFLDILPLGTRAAFEFRHPSWFDEEVYETLRKENCPICIADTEEHDDTQIVSTADWGYLRLRKPGYSKPQLKGWHSEIEAQGWGEAFVFFKHEDEGAGPAMAGRFLELAGGLLCAPWLDIATTGDTAATDQVLVSNFKYFCSFATSWGTISSIKSACSHFGIPLFSRSSNRFKASASMP